MESSHNRIIKKHGSDGDALNIGFYRFEEEKEEKKETKTPKHPPAPPGEATERQKASKIPEPEEEERGRWQEEEARRLLEEARKEGKSILEEARQEAACIKESAKAEAEQEIQKKKEKARKEGYEAGFAEGKQKGQQEGEEAWKTRLSSFETEIQEAMDSVKEAKERCLHTYLDELKDCVIAVAEKVIHISLKSSGEVIRQMIISATEKLDRSAWVKIYIDRPDYEMMVRADADLLSELSHLSDNIKFVVMDQEEEGSCIIERPDEILDLSVNTQIENIKDILANV